MDARASRHLWRWAGQRLKDRPQRLIGAFQPEPQQHFETIHFIDAVHTASNVLQWLLPVVRGLASVRHNVRGTTMAPEVENLSFLQNWNSADEFSEGVESAHQSVLGALWQPSDSPIPRSLRESLGPDALKWLTDARSGPQAKTLGEATVSARFESLGGPSSLEHIRGMDVSSLRSLRDPERMEAFHQDTWQGSPLQLVVATVSEAECTPSSSTTSEGGAEQYTVRRADRVHFSCDFNLRDGIAGAFSVTKVEELFVEEMIKGIDDADTSE